MSTAEQAWAGEFGDEYHARSPGVVANNIALFVRALARVGNIHSIIELGAGTGSNLLALRALFPDSFITAVEVNRAAATQCKGVADEVLCIPTADVPYGMRKHDLVLTKGFMIHVPPADLAGIYQTLYRLAIRYVLMCEYYNPTELEVSYRGRAGMLWKRPFAEELCAQRPFRLIDYGFVSKMDRWPQDDLHWHLMERVG